MLTSAGGGIQGVLLGVGGNRLEVGTADKGATLRGGISAFFQALYLSHVQHQARPKGW